MDSGNNKKKIYMLLGIYCLVLVWIILFKLSFSLEELLSLSGMRSINLIPFHYEDTVDFHQKEVIENLLIFIPFGLYLRMLQVKPKKVILLGFLFSFLLESSQYIFKLGAYDITDLLMNATGTTIGVFGYYLSEKLFRSTEMMNKVLNTFATIVTVLSVTFLLLLVFLN